MIFRCVTPGILRAFTGAVLVAALLQRAGVLLGYWTQNYNPNTPFALLQTAVYCWSFLLCLKIAGDHKGSKGMRTAWFLFAGSAALSVLRHGIQAVVASELFPNFDQAASYVPIQAPMALALTLLFAGLLAMWGSLSSLGLGFQPRRSDIAVMVAMLLMLPPILIRNAAAMPLYVSGWVTLLPHAGAILLPACGAIAVLLHRAALEMRGGETARALRCLIWYPGIRLIAMLLSVDPRLKAIPELSLPAYALYQVAPLIFALALAYRWQMSVRAVEALQAESSRWAEIYPFESTAA